MKKLTTSLALVVLAFCLVVICNYVYLSENENLVSESASNLSLTVAANQFNLVGYLDIVSCDQIAGWAMDPDTSSSAMSVHIYKDGSAFTGGAYVTNANTDVPRPDVNKAYGITGNHGFSIPFPESMKDGKAHTVWVHGIDTSGQGPNKELISSGKSITCAVPIANNAQFISQSVPTTMTAGQTYSVSVTMKNTGTKAWASSDLRRLGSQNPPDNNTWVSGGRVQPSSSVAVGQNTTFTFSVKAPSTASIYNFQWRMVQDGVGWFGDTTTNVPVVVSAPANKFILGHLDVANCDAIQGWTYDPDTSSVEMAVHLYKDGPAGTGTYVTNGVTNVLRADVNKAFGITGNHGFSIPFPESMKDGKAHTVWVHGIDTSGLGPNLYLSESGKIITCTKPAVVGKLNYHGFYFAENDFLNIHYLSELSGSNNIVSITYDHTLGVGRFQTLANEIRQKGYKAAHLTLGLSEAQFTNANGTRDIYLQKVKKDIATDSDFIKLVAFIHILEEEYTLLRRGFFDSWVVFKGMTLMQKRDRMKKGLEEYIADVNKYFPGIPTMIVENSWGSGADLNIPPSNLDVLGVDAYYIPSGTACDTTQKAKFDREVTDIVNIARVHKKPIYMVGAVFQQSVFKMPTACQSDWYVDLAMNTPEVIGLDWFLYADTGGVRGIRNYTGAPLQHIKDKGKTIVNAARPTVPFIK